MESIEDDVLDALQKILNTPEKLNRLEMVKVRPRFSAKLDRIARYGIRVQCLMCGWEGRHNKQGNHRKTIDGFPTIRLRERMCDSCGLKRLRPLWWIEKYPTKAHAETKRVRATSFMRV